MITTEKFPYAYMHDDFHAMRASRDRYSSIGAEKDVNCHVIMSIMHIALDSRFKTREMKTFNTGTISKDEVI